MTDACFCQQLSLGPPLVALDSLIELRALLDFSCSNAERFLLDHRDTKEAAHDPDKKQP